MDKKEKLHKEIMENALKGDAKDPDPLLKVFLGIAAIFVLALFLITFIGGGQSINYIESRLHSSSVSENYVLHLEDGREVHLTKEVFLGLQMLLTEDSKEFKACLVGKKTGNIYNVTDSYVPIIYERNYHSVTSRECNSSTIIPMHSHPTNSCRFSEQDIRNFAKFKETNPDAIIGVMCGFNRFIFYG